MSGFFEEIGHAIDPAFSFGTPFLQVSLHSFFGGRTEKNAGTKKMEMKKHSCVGSS
jgi:hypothetical protein